MRWKQRKNQRRPPTAIRLGAHGSRQVVEVHLPNSLNCHLYGSNITDTHFAWKIIRPSDSNVLMQLNLQFLRKINYNSNLSRSRLIWSLVHSEERLCVFTINRQPILRNVFIYYCAVLKRFWVIYAWRYCTTWSYVIVAIELRWTQQMGESQMQKVKFIVHFPMAIQWALGAPTLKFFIKEW